MRGIVLAGVVAVQCDGLIGDHAAATIGRCRVYPMGVEVGLGPCHEERTSLVQHVKASEVDVPAIHHVDGAGLRKQHIKRVNVVQLAVRDVDEAWDVATQVKQRVHLHRGFGRAKVRPRKHRQAQIDRRRVQGIDGAGKLQSQIVAGVEPSGLRDQPVCELCVDSPVARFVGIAKVARRTGSRKPA